MLGVTDLWTFVLGTIAIILLPGPNSLYVLATAAQRGVRQGYRAAYGVFLGDGILMFAAAAGVASLLRAFPALFTILKYAGAAYLGYVGIRMVIGVFRRKVTSEAPAEAPVDTGSVASPFRKAFTISMMNPKAILFFGGNRLAAVFRSRRALAQAGTSLVGALFVGFGIKLATASLLPRRPARHRQSKIVSTL